MRMPMLVGYFDAISIVAKVQHAADCDTLYIYPYTLDGGVHSADGRNQRHVVLSRRLIASVLIFLICLYMFGAPG